MDPSLIITIVGVLIAVGLSYIVSGLKARGIDLPLMSKQINDLHSWHNVEIPGHPGVKVWWNSPTVEEELKKQTDLIEKLIKNQEALGQIAANHTKTLVELSADYKELTAEVVKYLHARDNG